jgi:hypothetical protein
VLSEFPRRPRFEARARAGARTRRATLAALAALLALVLVAAGCGGGSGPTAEELVSQTAEQTGALTSFHLIVDIQHVPTSGSGLGLSFVDGDVAVPDRLSARVSGTFLGLPVSTDLIVVGSDFFLKVPFSGWRKIDVDTVPVAFFDPGTGVLAVIEGATGLTRDGSEEVAGTDCYRLRGTVDAASLEPLLPEAEGNGSVALELWIGKDDLLLRRLRLDGPVSPSEPAEAERTIELSAFDEPVSITAPST